MREDMTNGLTNSKVAVYWDFENIHAALSDLEHGEQSYKDRRFANQDALVNVKAVMDYVSGLGDVVVNRAYANWRYFSRYRDDLTEAGIDLIQLFPRGKNMKNSADIRLALDALEDLNHFAHITHVVVIASDSDFIALAQKVKQAGRTIIGIGVREATNDFWVKSCNEFKFYQTLLEKTGHAADHAKSNGTIPVREEEALLLKALKQLIQQKGENRVFKGLLKSLMLRMNPAFDEANYGFPTFSAFLTSFSDKVQIIDLENGGHVGLSKEVFEREFAAKGLGDAKKASFQTGDNTSLELAA